MPRHKQRMRRWRLAMGCLAVGGLFVLQLVLPLSAKAQPEACSLATLQGNYIWNNAGFVVQGEAAIPLALAGRVQIDAAGNMTGVFASSNAGQIRVNLTVAGTVFVQANCTGTVTGVDSEGGPINAALFIDPVTGHFTALQTDPGTAITYFARKDGF